MKSLYSEIADFVDESLPARGAWIEIAKFSDKMQAAGGRSPHGERGLKSLF